ncbi:MAG: aldose epimerase [Nevskia sp.]|nr:aldose epimerase [Nevskia sp.]
MPRYSIAAEHFGAHPTSRLTDTQTGAHIIVAHRGATLLRWDARIGGSLRTLSDGHRTPAELEAQSGMRFGLMAPFSNRIADARYRFDGEEFDLQPGVEGAQRGIRHGFVRHADFDLDDARADDQQASLRLSTQALRPGAFAGYPFAIDIVVRLSLRDNAVDYLVEATNVGDRAAPYGCGLHPYFRLADDGIEALQLQVPAQTLVSTDAALIPLRGAAAYVPVDTQPELDFQEFRAIDGRVIDQAYADLRADADDWMRTRLRDPRSGACLVVSQTGGLLHAFSADTVSRDRRAAIALEPVELPTDAFNRSECAAAVRLEPGQTRAFACRFELLA